MNNQELIKNLLKEETKYSKYYLLIIEKAKLENRKKVKKDNPNYIYYENHHILLKSIFPEYKDLKTNKWNGVLLTYREHILCHYLIYKHYKKLDMKYEESKAVFALQGMLGRNKKKSLYFKSRFYENMKVDLIVTEETKKKISDSLLGHQHSEETKQKISRAHKGKKSSKETKQKLKVYANDPKHNKWLTDKNPSKSKICCEYCNKEVNTGTYYRDHGINCLENHNLSKIELLKIKQKRNKRASHAKCKNSVSCINLETNIYERIKNDIFYKSKNLVKCAKKFSVYYFTFNNIEYIFITGKSIDKFIQEFNHKFTMSFFDRQCSLNNENYKASKKKFIYLNGSKFKKENLSLIELQEFYLKYKDKIYG